MAKSDRNMVNLTRSEAELMDRLSKGEKVAEIAADWGVSPRSVYRMSVQARLALGARTNRQAVATYARNGDKADV